MWNWKIPISNRKSWGNLTTWELEFFNTYSSEIDAFQIVDFLASFSAGVGRLQKFSKLNYILQIELPFVKINKVSFPHFSFSNSYLHILALNNFPFGKSFAISRFSIFYWNILLLPLTDVFLVFHCRCYPFYLLGVGCNKVHLINIFLRLEWL